MLLNSASVQLKWISIICTFDVKNTMGRYGPMKAKKIYETEVSWSHHFKTYYFSRLWISENDAIGHDQLPFIRFSSMFMFLLQLTNSKRKILHWNRALIWRERMVDKIKFCSFFKLLDHTRQAFSRASSSSSSSAGQQWTSGGERACGIPIWRTKCFIVHQCSGIVCNNASQFPCNKVSIHSCSSKLNHKGDHYPALV